MFSLALFCVVALVFHVSTFFSTFPRHIALVPEGAPEIRGKFRSFWFLFYLSLPRCVTWLAKGRIWYNLPHGAEQWAGLKSFPVWTALRLRQCFYDHSCAWWEMISNNLVGLECKKTKFCSLEYILSVFWDLPKGSIVEIPLMSFFLDLASSAGSGPILKPASRPDPIRQAKFKSALVNIFRNAPVNNLKQLTIEVSDNEPAGNLFLCSQCVRRDVVLIVTVSTQPILLPFSFSHFHQFHLVIVSPCPCNPPTQISLFEHWPSNNALHGGNKWNQFLT